MGILRIVDLNDVVHRHKLLIEKVRRELEEAIAELAEMSWLSPAIRDSKKYTLIEKANNKIAILKRDCRNNLLAAKEHNITTAAKEYCIEMEVKYTGWENEDFNKMREFREKEVYTLTADL